MTAIEAVLAEHAAVVSSLERLVPAIEALCERASSCLRGGGTIFWMGNGGSAADSQHLAAELVGRFRHERRGLSSVALTTDTSILTAIGNDYGFDAIFERQLEALCTPRDLAVGISTSGSSADVVRGLAMARRIGASTVALCGNDGGDIAGLADLALVVSSSVTARIQEAHLLIGHIVCERIEESFLASEEP